MHFSGTSSPKVKRIETEYFSMVAVYNKLSRGFQDQLPNPVQTVATSHLLPFASLSVPLLHPLLLPFWPVASLIIMTPLSLRLREEGEGQEKNEVKKDF